MKPDLIQTQMGKEFCGWEDDYIRYILKDRYNENFSSKDSIGGGPPWKVKKNAGQAEVQMDNNIFCFGSNKMSPEGAEDLVGFFKPKLIFHLSDEWGKNPDYLKLSENCLYFRQYYHPNYDYPDTNNIIHIPLGYMKGMMEKDWESVPLKNSSDRKYKWSFIGDVRNCRDRKKMKEVMSSIEPYYHGMLDKQEMREIYRNSVFVCNGMGRKQVDCFRLYEATICGAIPIVVCSQEEYDNRFKHMDSPPWLRFDSWEEARDGCQDLIDNHMDKLNKMHLELRDWWNNIINKIRSRVDQALTDV